MKYLFSPIKIRTMELANRVVMAPIGTNLGNPDSTVSDSSVAYLKRRVSGGLGLVITEIVGVHPNGLVIDNQLGVFDNRFIAGLKRFVDTAHKAGCKIAIQLHHAGRESYPMLLQGKAIGPSAIPSLIYRMRPKEMTREDIEEVIFAFGNAAIRAQEAGFDALEIHGAHGYLLAQFLSGLSNQRSDQYGGSIYKRARFVVEVLEEVRDKVGDDFPISLRLSMEEWIKGGYTTEEMQEVIPDFIIAGADIIHASVGTYGSPGNIMVAPVEYASGFNLWRAKKVKDVTTIPVIAVGRFTDPVQADDAIRLGDADLVAFGRQFLADPDFLIKARDGRSDEIRKCIACNQGCIERLMFGEGNIRCAINPETGQELVYPQIRANTGKTVWVIGAGPAGLTAAYEAAKLGHRVSLFEKEEKMGGQIRFACKTPHKEIYGDWIAWLAIQVEKAGVEIHTKTMVMDGMVKNNHPDAVILAVGGEKIIPSIQGIDQPFICDAWQLLGGEVLPKSRNVVIGGGLIGMETADFLSSKGVQVILIEKLSLSPLTTLSSHGFMLHNRLREGHCELLFSTIIERIEENTVYVRRKEEKKLLTGIDQIVIAVGLKPRDDLKKTLQERGIRHFIVGDAVQPRRIIEATEEGAKAAWQI
jgi:2,4-dienoyl-CoA reductase-like NADH-dependent reductase (Old Yellow Enzyme family)/thioredoxin reductase